MDKKINVNKWLSGTTLVALICSVLLFVIMLNVEKNALLAYEKGTIYVATQRIPEGMAIVENNYAKYFEQKELDKKVIPETAITTPEQLIGLVAYGDIDKGTLITTGMFEGIDEITKNMENPVIAGFKAEDLYQVVGGTLRAGDRIHIYKVDAENVATRIWENVYVQQVFDNIGTNISNEDTSTAAQRINVYIDSNDVALFYSELSAGSLRVVKVLD